MKAVEFAYWLQGYFEIQGVTDLTIQQFEKIAEKIKTVKAGTGEAETKAKSFIDGATAMVSITIGTAGLLDTDVAKNALIHNASKALSEQLNDLFLHAIDQSYEGDQTQFNNIHKPQFGGTGPNGEALRC